MCGILGFFNPFQHKLPETLIENSLKSIIHRGPDNTGKFKDKILSFGMNRLSIIDLENGHQPFFDHTKRFTLIYNGEIYNYKYLKSKFLSDYEFKSSSDTEVLLAGLIKYGYRFLENCNGIFTFAFYDKQKSKLLIGRDPLGIKPLYYYNKDGLFFFSSELKPFYANNNFFNLKISNKGISNYLTSFYTFSPDTSVDEVKSLEPGSVLTISKDLSLSKNLYYPKDFIISKKKGSFNLQNEIVNAVNRQLVSDVPIGLLLSSGLDSMSILASLKKLNKLENIETYTSFYENKNFSEDINVKKISNEWGIKSNFYKITTSDVYENLDDYFKCYDDLEFMPNSFAMYFLCKNIRKKNKVLLTGIGGDEIFLSYKTHIANYIKKFFPQKSNLPIIINNLVKYLPNSNTYLSFKEKLDRFLLGASYDIKYSYFIWRNIFSQFEIENFFNNQLLNFDLNDNYKNQIKVFENFMNNKYSLKQSMSYIDIHTWLIDHGLKLWDKAGMYHSIEIRVPFLDLEFLNNLFNQPDQLRNIKYGKKSALYNSFSDFLPNYVLKFPKRGFSIPVFDWLSDPKINLKFKELTYELKGNLISEKFLKSMWSELDNGNNQFAFKLWNLGCFQGWKNANKLEYL